jgi:hypothetical protein
MERHGLGAQQLVRDPQADVERLARQRLGRHGDAPLGVREPRPPRGSALT